MSFYRTLFATIAAAALISPVLANDDNSTSNNDSSAPAMQVASNDQGDSSTTTTTTTTTQGKINLNSATAKQLMKVDGLNAAKARAIISYRKKHGEFKSLDELTNVKGLKKLDSNTLQNIQNQLTIE